MKIKIKLFFFYFNATFRHVPDGKGQNIAKPKVFCFQGEGREGGMDERERYEFIHSDLLNFS